MQHKFEEWYMQTFKDSPAGDLAYTELTGYVNDTVSTLWLGFQAGYKSNGE